ncbi:MAG TPA: indolepyruvate ferredoxin oxidoreductase subunit alpha [Pyrodictium sp.]|nr:indolepyruvate ferredoxin oxidoreductase subunit alpha [Pyrodictium sp.]
MPRYDEVLEKPGTVRLMLGNVAIARGFLEAGVQFVAAYPGTPSSEIVEALAYASRKLGVPYVEWSVNEKVALEAACGAAIAGARAVVAMKHVGLNVAADPFFSISYMGVEGALVVVSADDPWMWSSQNEQDNRWYGLHAYVLTIEPTGPQDALEAAKLALEYSSKLKKPVLLRSTTRISHTRAPQRLGKIDLEKLKPNGKFQHDPSRWTLIPQYARRHKLRLVEYWEELQESIHDFPLNGIEGVRGSGLAIVGVGIGYRYAREAVKKLGLEDQALIVRVSTSVPLPRKLAEDALEEGLVLVVEEGDPVVETQLKAYALEVGSKALIFGKRDGLLPLHGELRVEVVAAALAKIAGLEYEGARGGEDLGLELPPRPPVMCPGCPYRPVFYSLKRAANKLQVKPVYAGDIGCYSLGILPPFQVQDIILEMGGSIGSANGLAHVLDVSREPVIAIIGDSTFYHSGITPLLNAVYNGAPLLAIVLDNHTTAMTGHQPHPGTGNRADGRAAPCVDPEQIARGLGVEVYSVDAFDVKGVEETFANALSKVLKEKKPIVVVARGACILVALSEARRKGLQITPYMVVEDRCVGCGVCYKVFACPAISGRRDGKAKIDPALCTGCGVCVQVCPFNAIIPARQPNPEWHKIMRTAKPR